VLLLLLQAVPSSAVVVVGVLNEVMVLVISVGSIVFLGRFGLDFALFSFCDDIASGPIRGQSDG
jgi:hypothetical protein